MRIRHRLNGNELAILECQLQLLLVKEQILVVSTRTLAVFKRYAGLGKQVLVLLYLAFHDVAAIGADLHHRCCIVVKRLGHTNSIRKL